ncbi:MarR family winged helix-turn-helix transcriptional regulator [Mycobacteroides abscessus]|uniref:MarR family winged helix-turn-helix transcriptional regulator n=1 Tax=Mycobacteroides abscessus TaxID=36809 RepID=UPI00139046D3|nr:MarR family transcriptional regulator [Mycobacteroides abscessus]
MLAMSESDEIEPLGYLMFRAGAVMRPRVLAVLRPLGLGMPEFMCLRMLNENPGRTSAELARENNVSAQAMNQVLNGLQNVALVSRPAVPASGRALPAKVTAKGKALLKRVESAIWAAEDEMFSRLGVDDKRELRRILGRLIDAASENE